jgi:FMN phosphatase YigB (HAD superfamily)
VFIDDLKANVKAAQLLGWQGIHFDSPRQLQADLALLGL